MPALHGIYWKKSVSIFINTGHSIRKYCRLRAELFTEHFRDILVPVNRKFLAMVEEEEKGEHEEFYIHFFSDAFLAALVRWLEDRECVSPQEFSALLRSSVEMIAKYVLQSQK